MSAQPSSEAISGTEAPREATPEELPTTVRWSEKLRVLVDKVGRWGSWLILPLVIITCYDIIVRKIRWTGDDDKVVSLQLWLIENGGRIFESTILQELEWHFHTGLFALVLGYGYIWNSHVRVDLVREKLSMRKKAWLEFIGLVGFLIPYTCVVIWFATIYAYDSYQMGEISASTVGLTQRWIIKSVLAVGLLVALIAGFSVLLQVIAVLWGPQNLRYPLMTLEWPEEEGSKIEGKERLDLASAVDTLEHRARASGHLVEDAEPPAATRS